MIVIFLTKFQIHNIMLLLRNANPSTMFIILTFSITFIEVISNELDFKLISASLIQKESNELELIFYSSNELDDLYLLSQVRNYKSNSKTELNQGYMIQNYCLEDISTKLLTRSNFDIMIILSHGKDQSVRNCSDEIATFFQIESDPKLLWSDLEIAENLALKYSYQNEAKTIYISIMNQRKLEESNIFCEDFYFKSQNGSCESCIEGCSICENKNECKICYWKYSDSISYWLDLAVCHLCKLSGCSKCQTSDICEICNIGYFKNLEGKCILCEENCQFCNETTCTICNQGYFLNDQFVCEPCIWACEECFDNQSCIKCGTGNFFNSTISSCQPCDSYCEVCTNSSECIKCQKGVALVDAKCLKCPQNCEVCDSELNCEICEQGFLLGLDKKCSICFDANCKFCQEDTCSDCKLGFYYDNSTNKCQSCPSNCILCENYNKCLSCLNGPVIQNKCLECNNSCKICTPDEVIKYLLTYLLNLDFSPILL